MRKYFRTKKPVYLFGEIEEPNLSEFTELEVGRVYELEVDDTPNGWPCVVFDNELFDIAIDEEEFKKRFEELGKFEVSKVEKHSEKCGVGYITVIDVWFKYNDKEMLFSLDADAYEGEGVFAFNSTLHEKVGEVYNNIYDYDEYDDVFEILEIYINNYYEGYYDEK